MGTIVYHTFVMVEKWNAIREVAAATKKKPQRKNKENHRQSML